MKKIKYLIISLVASILILPLTVLASGSISVSTTNLTITKGSSATFSITANNAAGAVTIVSANPSVASVSSSDIFLDMNPQTITVSGLAAGTTFITVANRDVTTYDDENLTGRNITISVTVVEPAANQEPAQAPSNNYQNNNNVNNNDNLSNNNNLKELTVENHQLTKVDDNNYTLSVSNIIDSINVHAIAEDETATISGVGVHNLQIGENVIEIVITSASGAPNKIILKVTRKDKNTIEDLDYLLKESKSNTFDIAFDKNSKITKEMLDKIKASGKIVNLNYYDNTNILYTWIIDGQKLTNNREFIPALNFNSPNKDKIDKLSNYASGNYISFNSQNLPKGIRLKLYVKDKFADGNKVNVYYYRNNKLKQFAKSLKVDKGYIEFAVGNYDDYFLTLADLSLNKVSEKESNNLIIILVELAIIVLLIVGIIVFAIKQKKKNILNKE